MAKQNNPSDDKGIAFSSLDENLIPSVGQLYVHTKVDLIIVNDDKVKLWLMDNWKYIERQYFWVMPLGIIISIFLTFSTCSFKDNALWLTGAEWKAFFLFAALIFVFWLLFELGWFINMRCRKKVLNIDKMIQKLKDSSIQLKVTTESQTDRDFIETWKQLSKP